MSAAHLHLAVVHVPIIGIPLFAILLAIGFVLKEQLLEKSGEAGIAIIAILSIIAYLSGEGAEEIVEHLPGVLEAQIERHEARATAAFITVLVSGVVSVLALFGGRYRPHWRRVGARLTLACATLATVFLLLAANEGGKIRHTELVQMTDDDRLNTVWEDVSEENDEDEREDEDE